MPEMDALKASEAIRANEKSTGGHVPFIAMTAHALKGDQERCPSAGMDAYISKPIRTSELFAAMDTLLAGTQSPHPDGPSVIPDVIVSPQ